MGIKIEQFGGIAPKISPHLLPISSAVKAVNMRLDRGAITPLKAPVNINTVPAGTKSIYKNGNNLLHWPNDVDVVKSPVQNDKHDRLYYTGDGRPKYLIDASSANGNPTGFYLGVPAPTYPPAITINGESDDTLSGKLVFTPNKVSPGNPGGTLTLLGNAVVPAQLVQSGSFRVGVTYVIETIGTTDFVASQGASSNTVGVSFVAISAGTATTGTARSKPRVERTQTGSTWSIQAYSQEYYKDACVLRCRIPVRGYACMIGINSDPTANASYTSLDFAFYAKPDGKLEIYESNVRRTYSGTYNENDTLEIEYKGKFVYYKKNGEIVRTAETTGGRTFYLDSSLNGPTSGSGTWSEIWDIEFGVYEFPIASPFKAGSLTLNGNATVSGNSVTKNRATASWDTQAFSLENKKGRCVLRFAFQFNNKLAAAGLNKAPLTASTFTGIRHCYRINTSGVLSIYESGTLKGNFGTYTPGDILEISYEGTTVTYTNRTTNTFLLSSTVAADETFYFDSSLYSNGASITNIALGEFLSSSQIVDLATSELERVEKTRFYVFTYVTPQGEEGPPSPAAEATFSDIQSATLTFTADDLTGYNLGAGAKRRIYRTAVGTTETNFLFVTDVDINAASVTDNSLDASLGEIMPSTSWFEPPVDMIGLLPMPNGILTGFSGNVLAVSEAYLPHAWNPSNQLSFTTQITATAISGDSIVVFCKDKPYFVTGTTPDNLSVVAIDNHQTCISRRSVVNMGGYSMFASPDGLFSVSGNDVQMITYNILTKDQWQVYDPETLRGFFHDGFYIGFTDNYAFMLDMRSSEVSMTEIEGVSFVGGYSDKMTDTLYLVDAYGNVAQWEAGSPMSYLWRSKPVRNSFPLCPSSCRVFADGSVTLKLIADGNTVFLGSRNDRKPFRLPSGYQAIEFVLELSGTSKVDSVAIAESMSDLS